MFISENSFKRECRGEGIEQAIAYYADINQYTRLHGIHEGMKPRAENEPKLTRKEKLQQQEHARASLYGMRALLDFNEHFIELSNGGEEKRSLGFMLLILSGLVLSLPIFGVAAHFMRHGVLDWVLCLMVLTVFGLIFFVAMDYWTVLPSFFWICSPA